MECKLRWPLHRFQASSEKSARILADSRVEEIEAECHSLKQAARRSKEAAEKSRLDAERCHEVEKQLLALQESHAETSDQLRATTAGLERLQSEKEVADTRLAGALEELGQERQALSETRAQLEDSQSKCAKLQETLKLYI